MPRTKQKWDIFLFFYIIKLKQSVWFHFCVHVTSGNISTTILLGYLGSIAGFHFDSYPFLLHSARLTINIFRIMHVKNITYLQNDSVN